MLTSKTFTSLGGHLSPASFWVPQYLEPSAWVDHAPFAFWLMEKHQPRTMVELGTHGGYSYFAFCQAVKTFDLSTQCYAVDTWKGDDHSGFYGEDIFQRVSEYNEAHYLAFSRLVRATFDEAVKHFGDGSIDLLHIDGRHFYDDVRHDFDTWRPKLSDRAVVLIHDTNVRERDFGVFRLWEELREEFPSFEFMHGHGLGMLGYGANFSQDIIDLFSAMRDAKIARDVRHTYGRLGGALKADVVAKEAQATAQQKYSQLQDKLGVQKERIAELEVYAVGLEADVREAFSKHEVQSAHSAVLEAEVEEHVFKLGARDRTIGVLRDTTSSLEDSLRSLENSVYSLKNSTSWKVTAPLRFVRRVLHGVASANRYYFLNAARAAYRHAPLPLGARRWITKIVFRLMPGLQKQTSSYKKRQNVSNRGKKSLPPPVWQQKPQVEVARSFEVDFSAAVPFNYKGSRAEPPRLAVICHLYYENMVSEFRRYLANIPFSFDLFISTDAPVKKVIIDAAFEGWNHGALEIRVAANRGRDTAPKLTSLRDVYDSYEYVLHIHSKTSDHASVLANWRGFLLENLLGSADIVNSVFDAFNRRPDLGIIASQHFEPMRQWVNWGSDFKAASALAQRMGIELSEDKVLDFPSGSMFWARTAALKPLTDLSLVTQNFDIEAGRIDGTLAHAIERLYFHICEHTGFQWIKISHPPLFEHTPAIVPIGHPEALDQFMSEHTLQLTRPGKPPLRTEYPTPVKPSRKLISLVQERALGCDQAISPGMHVAVGIVTYNNTDKQIDRIVNSSLRALMRAGLATQGRILIVDNGESSQSITRAHESVVHLPSADNVGFGKAHNRLMAEAFERGAGIYVAANPDGAFHPDAIVALAQMLKAHDDRALIEAMQFPQEHPKPYDPFTFETPWASGACFAIPRCIFEKTGGFDDAFFMYCEDVDLSWRARANGFAVRICPRAIFLHAVTDRRRDPERLKLIFSSGVALARKWGGSDFEAWLAGELKALGADLPNTQPVKVPGEWLSIADFDHQFSFARVRW